MATVKQDWIIALLMAVSGQIQDGDPPIDCSAVAGWFCGIEHGKNIGI